MLIKNMYTAVDTHTEGGITRVVTSGIPKMPGTTITQKLEYFQSNLDHIRKILMCEPRGNKDMHGAILLESPNPTADIGVFFLKSAGYLDLCVHGAMGVVTAGLETGFISRSDLQTPILLDTPAGVISMWPKYCGEKLESVALETNPIFVHTKNFKLDLGLKAPITASIVFSDVFFVLVETKQVGIESIQRDTDILRELGVKIIEGTNQLLTLHHPNNPEINSVGAAIFYNEIGASHCMNFMVSNVGAIDWSPCGAGTGAKIALLYNSDKLKLGHTYVTESVIGTKFLGQVTQELNVGPYKGTITQISGSSYITGIHQFILDVNDPFQEGFCVNPSLPT